MEPGREYLCMKAGVMARMIGAFVAPPAHMRSLFFQSTCGGGSSNNNTNNAKDSNQQQQQQQQQPQQQQQQQQRRVRYDIVTHDEAIARLLMLNRADAEHLQVLQCEVGLQFMTEYGLCAPLTEAETRMYGKAGYVFPSLRYPCEVLAIPFLGDTTPVPPHVFVRRCTEWLCKACGHRAPSEPPSGCGCPFCGVAGCGAQVCSACHGDMHPELGPCGNLFLAKSTTALADGTVPCVPVGASSSSSSSSPQSSEAEAEVAATVSVPLRLAQCGCVDVRNGWEGKTLLGYRLRSSRNDLCFGAFSKLMMQLRPLIDPRYRVFSNLVALRDAIGNDIFVAFQPAALEGAQAAALVPAGPAFCDPHRGDAFIYIAVYGVTPCAWKSTVPALLEVCDVVEPLCLRCLQTDTFSVLLPPSANEGSDGNKNGSNVSSSGNNGSKAELICALGHKQQKQPQQQQKQYALTVARGVPLNPLARRNKLWAPLYRDKFYECSEGLWEVQGPARVTVLTDTEKTPARREEYLRARNAFYQFVGTNMEDVIRLTKVEFIQNDALETPFTGFSDKLTKRALVLDVPSLSSSSSSSSSSSTPNLLDGIMKELDSPNNNNNNSERRRGGGGGTSSNDKQEWGEWILGQLQKSMYRISGNEGINLILGWHGTSEANIRSIVQNNFYDMSDPEFAASRKTDPGFFGPGIYFSQYPTYGSSYAEKRKSNTLLLSWVLMGATYPVTEEPMTLTGLVPGYDSHYAIVDSKFGRPIRPTDPPGYDEIVVFHKAQVLPRYVIHFEKIDAPSTPHDPGSQTAAASLTHKLLSTTNSAFPGEPLPPDIRDAYPVFIWIDPDFNTVDATMSGFKIIVKTRWQYSLVY